MTESEAIKELHKIRPRGGIIPQKRAEAIDAAINALEEIEQYKALGTVDELRLAKEKQIPKKIKVVEDIRLDGVKEYFAVCPNCDKGTRFCVGIGNYNKYSLKNWIGNCYCSNCGQKLNWESDEE